MYCNLSNPDYSIHMDGINPDQYKSSSLAELNQQAFARLRGQFTAILAMSTGGCARYAYSSDAPYCLDRRGFPITCYSSPNPHHHLILTNSTMTLRLVHQLDPEGNEISILILTGMLRLVDPGDHDCLERHHRYFGLPIENYSRGITRLYRLEPEQVCFELFSGKRIPLGVDSIIRRNLFSEKEEKSLIEAAQLHFRRSMSGTDTGILVAGVDGFGVDVSVNRQLSHRMFPVEVANVQQAELAITGLSK